ncbi:hypothetical protein MCOR02_000417 [Pyricularia oryzae]|uniref:Kinetochore protein Sos7 coiled-coil domain-containing protein n=1 Tax=Pyricularia grisea TaxID=148305 RepID=A0ABQ8NCS1_PYRGI|nr:hypothetical protein MCOR02_000417 [Pyricularia oryzae]KAI6294955.1 hypothetical protein MCOR33_008024 [Pyricularia grisea]KAI6312862.1 hypothetical protein MCOR29_007882 [Pyricularia oryzae]KAI6384662.1 hypothetical protein MCOR32_001938 [Pyricularia oryzae]KAI6439169.1 hypothetical protein MCOR22_008183 [Pyricularia oryzae]
MDEKTAKVVAQIDSLSSKRELTIISLAEPITSAVEQSEANGSGSNNNVRTSDISTASLDAPTPASLEADLEHYKELFAKLRFSYVEQVTKEKFIRAIVGDPPLIVDPSENAELEAGNAAVKAELKALKREVEALIAELERKGADLARRQEKIELERVQLAEMPGRIGGLEEAVAELRSRSNELAEGGSSDMRLPLAKTVALVEQRAAEVRELDRRLETLKAAAPRKRKEMERLQAELVPLEAKRQNSTAAAKEAKRRKEAALGGAEDDLEERGRWWRASEALLKSMLEIKN